METTLRAVASLLPSPQQRRQDKRVAQCFQVDFKVLSDCAALSAFSRMESRNQARHESAASDRIAISGENLSYGGVGIAGDLDMLAECPLAEQSFVEMTLDIPQAGRSLKCVGTVAWIRVDSQAHSFRAGVSFLEIDQEDLSLVMGTLKRLSAPWHWLD